MEDAVHALMMAFAVIVFVIAFSIAIYMFTEITSLAETLTRYSDTTLYYDNIKYDDENKNENTEIRIVNADTIIPTLYRYADEEFCVKIYDTENTLIQIFDLDLEGKVQSAIGDTNAEQNATSFELKQKYAFKKIYNVQGTPYYLFGAPWFGNKENIKLRVDLFVNGKAGYINNSYVDYSSNRFTTLLADGNQFEERFINYSWSGQTFTTDEGDVLVTGNSPKDKIVIIYKALQSNIT